MPYLLELQADMLSALDTCLVAPLVPAAAFGPVATRLNPAFRIGYRKFVLDTALMAGVPRKLLGARVATLADRSVDIVSGHGRGDRRSHDAVGYSANSPQPRDVVPVAAQRRDA